MRFDRSKYPPHWPTIRRAILRRAGRRHGSTGNIIQHARCELCGVLDHSQQRRGPKRNPRYIKVILTIMHLNHDPENWNVLPDELAAACQRCHWRYDHPAQPTTWRGKRPPRARARIRRSNVPVTIDDVRMMNAPPNRIASPL